MYVCMYVFMCMCEIYKDIKERKFNQANRSTKIFNKY